ncbi:acyl dehydratase [Arthrobacter sp. CAN_A214]
MATEETHAVAVPAGAGERPGHTAAQPVSGTSGAADRVARSSDGTADFSDGTGRRVIEQRGRYVDELVAGAVYAHRPGRTLTEADNVLFTTLTMNTQALHLDAAWASRQPFGQRLINSMMTLAVMVGQSVSQLTQGTIVAQLGLTDVAFPHPLFQGDTLYTETEIVEVRSSASRPGQGIVKMMHIGRNQHGEVVARASRSVLMWSREGHAAQEKEATDE